MHGSPVKFNLAWNRQWSASLAIFQSCVLYECAGSILETLTVIKLSIWQTAHISLQYHQWLCSRPKWPFGPIWPWSHIGPDQYGTPTSMATARPICSLEISVALRFFQNGNCTGRVESHLSHWSMIIVLTWSQRGLWMKHFKFTCHYILLWMTNTGIFIEIGVTDWCFESIV